MDCCMQAVVWSMKASAIDDLQVSWFVELGQRLAAGKGNLRPGIESSWYRALAMIPAAEGDRTRTVRLMEQAREAAESAVTTNPGPYETHLIKTYYESMLKTHMFVTRDKEAAVETGLALIELDPVWSPSLGELGQALRHFGDFLEAAVWFERAVNLGAPYYGHHSLAAAECYRKIGRPDLAVIHYRAVAELAPDSPRLAADGLTVAHESGNSSQITWFEEMSSSAGAGSSRPHGQ